MSDEDGYFGEEVAATYDELLADESVPAVVDPVVDVLAELAGAGSALEFGIGTGRIALPLAARGVRVQGIDLSRAMVRRLHAKPGGEGIDVAIGDFATTVAGDGFALVYLLCNTIMNVTTQAGQLACFRNAAAHLRPGGHFVIDVTIPELRRLPPGGTTVVFAKTRDHFGFDEYAVAEQGMVSHHFEHVHGAWRYLAVPFRYVWPAELDLMAQLAGMSLRERWASWHREPFTSESRRQVSIWQKAA